MIASGCASSQAKAPGSERSATGMIAERVRRRVPGWHIDTVHGYVYVFGDPDADVPGRQVVCDGLTERPIITGHAHGVRVEITLPHLSDGSDAQTVLDVLTAAGVLPGEPEPGRPRG